MFLYNDIIAIFYVLAMKKTTGRQHYKPKLKKIQRPWCFRDVFQIYLYGGGLLIITVQCCNRLSFTILSSVKTTFYMIS